MTDFPKALAIGLLLWMPGRGDAGSTGLFGGSPTGSGGDSGSGGTSTGGDGGTSTGDGVIEIYLAGDLTPETFADPGFEIEVESGVEPTQPTGDTEAPPSTDDNN